MNGLGWITFGGGGHEREYVLNLPDCDHKNYIPNSIERQLQELLPGWDVCNRGTRIEITHREPYGIRNDGEVLPAVGEVCGPVNCALPVLLVLDEESDELVECAVISDREDSWLVKPLSEAHFDPKELGGNRAFHMAFWRVAKDDASAELTDQVFHTGRVVAASVKAAFPFIAPKR